MLFALLGGEVHRAAGRAGGGGQALGHRRRLGQRILVKGGMEHRVQAVRVDLEQRLGGGNQALVHQDHRDLERRGGGALAVTGLEHIELAALDGELHVLHVLVVLLQALGDVDELVIHVGHDFLKLGDGLRGADAGHDVLALGVHQELTVHLALAGGGIAGEGHAGAGVVAPVAEDHGLHVDGGAPGVGDVVHGAVDIRARVVPGAEDRLDRLHQLDLGVLRELLTLLLQIVGLELAHQALHIVCIQLAVELDAALFLHLVNDDLKVALGQLHHHVGEHLDEPAVGVIDKTGVVGQLDQALGHRVVDAQVEDGIHHAGHGGAGAGTDGDQQRVGGIAELLAILLFQDGQILQDLLLNLVADFAAVLIILGAGLGRDGEALGHRHAGVGHLGQVGALTAEQLAHVAVALAEQVDILFAHTLAPLYSGGFGENHRKIKCGSHRVNSYYTVSCGIFNKIFTFFPICSDLFCRTARLTVLPRRRRRDGGGKGAKRAAKCHKETKSARREKYAAGAAGPIVNRPRYSPHDSRPARRRGAARCRPLRGQNGPRRCRG